jgi:hypothetical protein
MELHTTYEPSGSESIYDVDRRVAERTQVLALLPEDRFLCSFSHIFAGLPCCQTFYIVQIISYFTFSFVLSIMCRWLCCWILQLQGNVYFEYLCVLKLYSLNVLEDVLKLLSCRVHSGLKYCQLMHSQLLKMLVWIMRRCIFFSSERKHTGYILKKKLY